MDADELNTRFYFQDGFTDAEHARRRAATR